MLTEEKKDKKMVEGIFMYKDNAYYILTHVVGHCVRCTGSIPCPIPLIIKFSIRKDQFYIYDIFQIGIKAG